MTAKLPRAVNVINRSLFGRTKAGHKNDLGKTIRSIDGALKPVWPYVLLGLITNILIFSVIAFYTPAKALDNHYSAVCVHGISLFPSKITTSPSSSYDAYQPTSFSIAGMPIISTSTCVSAYKLPTAGSSEIVKIKQFGLPIEKNIVITTAPFATPTPRLQSDDKLSTKANLVFDLPDKSGNALDYIISANNAQTPCLASDSAVVCRVTELALTQGQKYDFVLARSLGDKVETAYSHKFVTVEPIEVALSSIADSSTVYDQPSSMTLQFNKPVKSYTSVRLLPGDNGGPIDIETELSDDKTSAKISWRSLLPRASSFRLEIPSMLATDGAYLDKPYELAFSTSAGPKVTDINIDNYGVSTDPEIVITFDQEIIYGQDVSGIIKLNGGSASVSIDKNQATIVFNEPLDKCVPFSITISDALQNQYGVSGGNAYEFSSRTVCQTVGSIGNSVMGNQIVSYTFGIGPEEVLFIGNLHGDEKSAKYLLDSWVDFLEQNPDSVPSGKTVVVIPSLNPDGFEANSRTNANGVDLNRNFPALSWKSIVKMPDGVTLEQGGGAEALSEPESSALASYIELHRPSFVASYHSRGGLVMANGTGNSYSIASNYSDSTGYADESYASAEEVFTHDTTGAFEDWMNEKQGIPVILVELNTHTRNEFSNHRSAMVDIVNQ